MKRLIRAEFFNMDIFRDSRFKDQIEYTIFKNPTNSEFNEVMDSDEKDVRGIIQNDGTIYIWKNKIMHDYVINKFNLNWDVKFEVVRDLLILDIKYSECNDTLLKSIANMKNMFRKSADDIFIIFEVDEISETLQDFIDYNEVDDV